MPVPNESNPLTLSYGSLADALREQSRPEIEIVQEGKAPAEPPKKNAGVSRYALSEEFERVTVTAGSNAEYIIEPEPDATGRVCERSEIVIAPHFGRSAMRTEQASMRLRIRGFRRFRVISLAVPDATGHFITWTNSDGTDACAQLDRVRGANIEIFEHAVISAHRCHVLFSESSVEPAAAGAERIPQARHAWPGSMGL